MTDAIISSVGPLAVALLSLLTIRLTLHGLGDATYGVWIAALTLGETLGFLNLGLGRSIARHITQRTGDGEDAFLEAAFFIHIAFGLVGGVALAAAGAFVPGWLGVSGAGLSWAAPLFALAGVVFLSNQIVSFCNEVLIGQQRFRAQNLIATSAALARFVGLLVLAWAGMTAVRVGVVHATVAAATIIPALLAIDLRGLGVRLVPRRIAWPALAGNLRFGALSQLIAALSAITWQSGALILGFVLGSAAITPFYVGMRFPAVLLAAAWNIASVLFPAASRRSDDEDHSRMVLVVGARLAFLVIAPAALVLMLVPDLILGAWLDVIPPGAAVVLRLAAIAVIADAIASSSIQLLWGQAVMRPVVTGAVAGAAIALVVTSALVPQWGAAGAAIGLSAAVVGAGILYVAAALRRAHYPAVGFFVDLFRGILLPLLIAGLAMEAAIWIAVPTSRSHVIVLCALTATVFYAGFWRFGTNASERALLSSAASRIGALKSKTRSNAM